MPCGRRFAADRHGFAVRARAPRILALDGGEQLLGQREGVLGRGAGQKLRCEALAQRLLRRGHGIGLRRVRAEELRRPRRVGR